MLLKNLFQVYVSERELLDQKEWSQLSVSDWMVIARRRANNTALGFKTLLRPFSTLDSDDFELAFQYLASIVLRASCIDDIKDLEIDWRRQANILAAVASERFPHEYVRLTQRLDQGLTYFSALGMIRLLRHAPMSLATVCRIYTMEFKPERYERLDGLSTLVFLYSVISAVLRRMFSNRG